MQTGPGEQRGSGVGALPAREVAEGATGLLDDGETMGISAAMSQGPAPSRRKASSLPVTTRSAPWQVPDPMDGLRTGGEAGSSVVQSSAG